MRGCYITEGSVTHCGRRLRKTRGEEADQRRWCDWENVNEQLRVS